MLNTIKSGKIFKILFLKNITTFSALSNSEYSLIITKKLTPIKITAYSPIQAFSPFYLINLYRSTIKINVKIPIISIVINFKTPNFN